MALCLNSAYNIIKEYEDYKNLEPLKKLLKEGGKELQDQGIRDLILDLLDGKTRHKAWKVNKNTKKIEERDFQIIGLIYYYIAKGFPEWEATGNTVTCCDMALKDIKEMSKERGWPKLTSSEHIHKKIWSKRKEKLTKARLKFLKDAALSIEGIDIKDCFRIYKK